MTTLETGLLKKVRAIIKDNGGRISIRKIDKPYSYDDMYYYRNGFKRMSVWFDTEYLNKSFIDSFREKCLIENSGKCKTGFNFGVWVMEDENHIIVSVFRNNQSSLYIKNK